MIDRLPLRMCSGGSKPTPPITLFSGRVDGKLGEDSSPLPLATKSLLPSVATAHGYQPVGTNPTTRVDLASAMSAIITSSLSALATNSVLPSGETVTALGVDPSGEVGYRLVETISSASVGGGAFWLVVLARSSSRGDSVRSTRTVLSPAQQTKR